MTLEQLLRLVPRFRDGIRRTLEDTTISSAPAVQWTEFKEQLTQVLTTYKDVFAWSYEDMKGLNPEFYHHKINLAKDAIPV
jgi:hypothetical protein